MTDFLLELRCEEIPARMQLKASEDFARLFTEELAKAGLEAARLTAFVTPRRLAIVAHDLPEATQAVSEEYKGPRTAAPAQALEGFLRKTGLTQEQLEDRDGIWFATVEKPGRPMAEVLAEAIPFIVRGFPWPKSMRWGAASRTTESLRWVRPLQGIVALLGGEIVPIEIDGIPAGRKTMGHRFHAEGAVEIESAATYADQLRAAHVIASHEERQAIIARKAEEAAKAKGYTLVEDKGLVAENAGLTEWPVPLLGEFDPAFLEVPPEVIQLTLRINQKYFVLRDAAGKLAPAFICTANIEATDGGAAIVAGNGKVLAARLSDARFFWEQDRKTSLEAHAQKLARITFHEKLGTVADKVERVAKLARWLVEEGIIKPSPHEGSNRDAWLGSRLGEGRPDSADDERAHLATLAEQAARLAKADLVTEMVGEFPELQGLMGGYYARAEGLPEAVADAIRDHYKPVGQGDDVPTAPVTVAVSLADKLDTLVGFYLAVAKPSGSKDPFALRRSVVSIIAILQDQLISVGLRRLIEKACFIWLEGLFSAAAKMDPKIEGLYEKSWDAINSSSIKVVEEIEKTIASTGLKLTLDIDPQAVELTLSGIKIGVDNQDRSSLLDFFADRLKVQQREAGVRHDLIDAVFALGGEDDLVRLLARVKALQAFVETEDGANLLAGYKRAANILKKEDTGAGAGSPIRSRSQAGEEDPFANVDDPVLAEAMQAHEGLPPAYALEPAEAALVAALDAAEPRAQAAIEAEDFAAAMAALATLRAPIDAFFDGVTVNDADPVKRHSRLSLLTRIRAAVHNVADFSRIEG